MGVLSEEAGKLKNLGKIHINKCSNSKSYGPESAYSYSSHNEDASNDIDKQCLKAENMELNSIIKNDFISYLFIQELSFFVYFIP